MAYDRAALLLKHASEWVERADEMRRLALRNDMGAPEFRAGERDYIAIAQRLVREARTEIRSVFGDA